MLCHSTDWAGVLDWGTKAGISPWAVALRALPALGQPAWSGRVSGRAHGQGRHSLALSLWLLGPAVTSELRARVGPRRRDTDRLVVWKHKHIILSRHLSAL